MYPRPPLYQFAIQYPVLPIGIFVLRRYFDKVSQKVCTCVLVEDVSVLSYTE
jgi:hypothetical protein